MSALGFSLVELLVVIATTAVISLVAYLNVGPFREGQQLAQVVLDLQSLIRSAQANASSRVECLGGGGFGANFWINFDGSSNINMLCKVDSSTTSTTLKTIKFPAGLVLDSVLGDSCASAITPTQNTPLNINFSPLFGAVTFQYSGATCITSSTFLTVTLKNTRTSEVKSLIIDKGGAVDVRQ